LRPAAGFTLLPEAATVGLARCPSLLRDYGRIAGEELAAVGINVTMAPVLDVANNPDNPVITGLGRSFGTTPEQVIEAAIPLAVGLAEAGVIATGKHFPGHGGTTTDSHDSLPFVEKDRAALDAVELAPYRAAVEAGFEAMMPAHVAFTALDSSGLPATVSAPIQTGLLREELGFGGVIVTDDMGMAGITSRFPPGEAAVRAVEAGADIVLCVRMEASGACPPDMLEQMRDGLLRAVADGRLSRERIDASVRRVLDLKSRHAVGPADGSGLERIKGAGHIRVVAEVLAKIADRLEAAGRP
jgi:beta-N-acetylhexosaminidase